MHQLIYYSGAGGRYPISDFINGPNVSVDLNMNESFVQGEFEVKPYFKEVTAQRIEFAFGKCTKFKGFFNQI